MRTTFSGPQIKSLRQRYQLTQEQLAHELSTTVVSVSQWENGHARPGRMATAALRRLAKHLATQAAAQQRQGAKG